MKLKGTNAGSKKTIDLIKKTFAELIEEKREIKSITVTELVKRANLTRGAFYSHYDNIYEVAQDFEEEILKQVFDGEVTITSKEDMYEYFDKIFNYLKENENIYTKLLSSNESMLFINRLNVKICDSLSNNLKHPSNHLNIIFFTDGIIHLIFKYFRKEINENLDEIRDYVKELANHIFFEN